MTGEVFECRRRLRVGLKSFEMLDELGAEVVEVRLDIPQHMLAGDFFKSNAATGRQVGKPGFQFAENVEAVFAEERLEFAVDAIPFVEVPDEIQNGEAFLARMQTQAAAELLEKYRQAVRGPEEKHGIHLGDVGALAEHIDREEKVHLALAKFFQCFSTLLVDGFTYETSGWQTLCIELLGHEPRVADARAESDAADATNVVLISLERRNYRLQTLFSQRMGAGVNIGQLGLVESTLRPEFIGIQ